MRNEGSVVELDPTSTLGLVLVAIVLALALGCASGYLWAKRNYDYTIRVERQKTQQVLVTVGNVVAEAIDPQGLVSSGTRVDRENAAPGTRRADIERRVLSALSASTNDESAVPTPTVAQRADGQLQAGT